ncbi:MAG: hypothetical protein KIT31_41225 [Deltaproteobacteria bacterium]|nr:hypothetical protein [Deltaproteobacteria bacterium]
MQRLACALFTLAVASCATTDDDLDEPQDALPGDDAGDGKADGACSLRTCGDPKAAAVLYPGNPACGGGCERNLAAGDLYIPPRNGRPWGDTYRLAPEASVLSGYSSGRIALLRRLALVGDGEHAILLDPSWPDGKRDFAGRGPERGEDIVRTWLLADPARTFTLIYSTRSIGWSNYAALVDDADVGAQVVACAVDVPHLNVPRVPDLHDALVDPASWDNGRCRRGVTASATASASASP